MNKGVEIEELIKTYDKKKVVNNVSISIDKPGVYLLAGPNGSGKTTLLEIIAGLREPDSGEVLINGYKCNTIEAKRDLGFLCQQNSLRKNLKVNEEIKLIKDIYGIDIDDYEYLKRYNLEQYYKAKSGNLSGGTKRRLLIAMLLMANQNIVVLDEPASGLDTNSRDEIWNVISEYSKDNIVIVSDHYLNQAALYSDYIYMLNEGKMILEGNMAEIRKSCKGKKLIKVRKQHFEEIESVVKANCSDYEVRISGTIYNIFINSDVDKVTQVLSDKKVSMHDIDLEDIYFYHTGKYSNEGDENVWEEH